MTTRRNFLRTGLALGTAFALPCCRPGDGPHTLDLRGEVVCGFWGKPWFRRATKVRDPSAQALRTVERIVRVVGLPQNFEVMEGEAVKGSAFAIIRNDRRYIVYDERFFRQEKGYSDWAGIGLLAHEVGHHLSGHTIDGAGSRWDRELEADHFAGRAVFWLGGSLEEALLFWKGLSKSGSETHPPRDLRMEAVDAGWRQARILARQGSSPPNGREPCIRKWDGEPFDLDSRTCRLATVCEGGRLVQRLACRSRTDHWLWYR